MERSGFRILTDLFYPGTRAIEPRESSFQAPPPLTHTHTHARVDRSAMRVVRNLAPAA